MSKYIASLIECLNHDASISELLDPSSKISDKIKEYRKIINEYCCIWRGSFGCALAEHLNSNGNNVKIFVRDSELGLNFLKYENCQKL